MAIMPKWGMLHRQPIDLGFFEGALEGVPLGADPLELELQLRDRIRHRACRVRQRAGAWGLLEKSSSRSAWKTRISVA
jgi:hypothetical protein